MIPANAPDRIGFRMPVTTEAARTGDFGELIAPHELPVIARFCPFPQGTAGCRRISEHAFVTVAIVRIHDPSLAAVEAFAMIARKF